MNGQHGTQLCSFSGQPSDAVLDATTYAPKPTYYALRHIIKWIRPNASPLAVTASGVSAVAYLNADGTTVVAGVNNRQLDHKHHHPHDAEPPELPHPSGLNRDVDRRGRQPGPAHERAGVVHVPELERLHPLELPGLRFGRQRRDGRHGRQRWRRCDVERERWEWRRFWVEFVGNGRPERRNDVGRSGRRFLWCRRHVERWHRRSFCRQRWDGWRGHERGRWSWRGGHGRCCGVERGDGREWAHARRWLELRRGLGRHRQRRERTRAHGDARQRADLDDDRVQVRRVPLLRRRRTTASPHPTRTIST
jgi:hypothetical protein